MITYETVVDDGSIQLILWTYEDPQDPPNVRPNIELPQAKDPALIAVM